MWHRREYAHEMRIREGLSQHTRRHGRVNLADPRDDLGVDRLTLHARNTQDMRRRTAIIVAPMPFHDSPMLAFTDEQGPAAQTKDTYH